MNLSSLQAGTSSRGCWSRALARGFRKTVIANAKRKGVSKELRELQQLKEAPTPPAPATTTAPAHAPTSSSPQATAAAAPTPVPAAAAPASPYTAASSSEGGSGSASTSSTSSAGTAVSGSDGGGMFDSLLLRILATVTAIMAVISVFYSIVFYGASNAVYIFKDQLSAVTKKDFVPYSERRRMEQEVLAKLQAERADSMKERAETATAAEGGSKPSGASGVDAGAAQDTDTSGELLNLLPSGSALGGPR